MKIITRLADIGMEVETDIPKEEAVQLVFEALQNGFQGQANDEAYFSESFLKESFVFGCDAPDKVCQIACRWNEDDHKQNHQKYIFKNSSNRNFLHGNLTYDSWSSSCFMYLNRSRETLSVITSMITAIAEAYPTSLLFIALW